MIFRNKFVYCMFNILVTYYSIIKIMARGKPAAKGKKPAAKPAPAPTKKAKTASGAAKKVAAPVAKPKKGAKAAAPSKAAAAAAAKKAAPAAKKATVKAPPAAAKKAVVKNATPAKEETKMVTMVKKGSVPVDAECPRASDCHVYEDSTKAWAATLNQTNIGNNNNKFYIVQLLQSDGGMQYYLWTRWGRVGYSGQSALQGPFGSAQQGISLFNSKYGAKTRGGYVEIEISYEADKPEKPAPAKGKAAAKKAPVKKQESKLDPRLQELISLICDVSQINQTLSQIGYDAKKMPLGKLSENTLKAGYSVLKDMEKELKKKAPNSGTLAQLSSKFYTLIPHDFGFQNMAKFVIRDLETLKTKVEMISNLSDMKIAQTFITEEEESDVNVLDEHYKKLNCKLTPLKKAGKEYKLIDQYVDNTGKGYWGGKGLKALDIYGIERQGEEARFNKKMGNNVLLWHGSGVPNFVGILSQGLRIAPPEAPVSGYRFDKGVYFADMLRLSAGYCRNSPGSVGCLLLCEVACGKQHEAQYFSKPLPKGTDSFLYQGAECPPAKSYQKINTRTSIPAGAPTAHKGGNWGDSQWVIYDVNQIKMKYIIRMQF